MNKNYIITGEQEICISCGICCDGTLFGKAVLQQGEKGSLPEKIEENYFKTDKHEFFKLPCQYFDGKCTIYNKKKAVVCSAYKCKLLLRFSNGKIQKEEALKIIQNVKSYKKEIEELAFINFNLPKGTPFITLQVQLNELKDSQKSSTSVKQLENIIAKCIILEILLTKYFRTKEKFDEMIINPVSEDNRTEIHNGF